MKKLSWVMLLVFAFAACADQGGSANKNTVAPSPDSAMNSAGTDIPTDTVLNSKGIGPVHESNASDSISKGRTSAESNGVSGTGVSGAGSASSGANTK